MGLLLSWADNTVINETSGNNSLLSLDEYDSDEALAAVKLFKDYPDALLQFASVCCVLFMLIGIPGNVITIVALARCKKVRNATALFIINLSFSDLLFCCFNLPLAATTFWSESWLHGKMLCRLVPVARYALVAVSLFTVLAITINRYIMIAHPRFYRKLYTTKYLVIMVAAIWIFCFGALITTWLEVWGRFSLDPSIGSCTIIDDIYGRSPKKFLFIGAFLLPGVAIVVCYARIFWIVKKVGKQSRAPLCIRPRTATNDTLQAESKSREMSLDASLDASAGVLNSQYNAHHWNCLSTPSWHSDAESSQDECERRTQMNRSRRSSNHEAMRKIRLAFNNIRHPKPLLPTKKDRKLRTMIMAIMLSFGLCHLPISVTKIFLELTPHPFLNIASYILLYLTTCINPIIYVVMSNEYRQAYKNLITCQRIKDAPESTGMQIVNNINKSFRLSKKNVKLKNTQDVNC